MSSWRRIDITEVPEVVRRFYSLCGAAQESTARLALAVAEGAPVDPDECERAIRAETLREHAIRILLDWPRLAGREPEAAALSAIPAADAGGWPEFMAVRLLGIDAAQWLDADWRGWAATGATTTARLVGTLRDETAALCPTQTALLTLPDAEAMSSAILPRLRDEGGFVRHPDIGGEPRETGPMARMAAFPPLAHLAAERGRTVLVRLFARLAEAATLAAGRAPGRWVQCLQTAPDEGLAWTETARGLLIHWVRLDKGRVRDYRIVAPTEWNFHPQGSVAEGLNGLAGDDEGRLRRRIGLLVGALDPCVRCDVEIEHA